MPTTKQMLEKYEHLMETSKSYYVEGHNQLSEYLNRIDTHTKYIRDYISAVYVFDFMSDEEFNKLFDEIYLMHEKYWHLRLTKCE